MVPRTLGRRLAAGIAASAIFLTPLVAFATTTANTFPTVGANLADVGITAWTSPGNITVNDASYASFSAGATSQYLRARDFNFAIPATATVTGIQVTVGRRATQTVLPGTRDLIVSLFKGGTGVVGDNKADLATDWPAGTITAANYGSTSDTWGTTWTPGNINASGFGVVLQADRNGETADVDYIRVKVTYTDAQTITVGTPAPASATYGDSFTVGATSDSALTVAVTTTGGCTNAGNLVTMTSGTTTCVVHYNQAGNTNFTVATEVTNNVTATKKALTVTADNDSKVYGTTNTYAGTEFTPVGLINADTVTSVTLASTGDVATATVAGSTYPIVASAAVGTGLDNYTISYVDGALTVTAAPLTITASNQMKTYGSAYTFLGTEFGTSGLLNTDTVASVTLTSAGDVATATVAGSTYPIVASAAMGTGLDNYSITYSDGSFTVNQKALTVTSLNQVKTYGDTFVFAGTEFTTLGLVNGDTVTSVSLSSAGDAATATVAGSPYMISTSAAMGTGLDNYSISYDPGTLTVNTATLTVTADNDSKVYGTTNTYAGTEFSVSGLLNTDTATSVTLNSTGDTPTAVVSGSPYSIVASAAMGTGLDNYTISYVDGALTVTTATLTITADNDAKTYGDTQTYAGTEFSTSGLVNTDTVTSVTLASTGDVATATVAGSTYPIVASAAMGTGLDNYSISYADGALTVNAAALTVTADNDSKVYGETNTYAGTEFAVSGLLNTDTVTSVTLSSTGDAATATVAGSTYPIVASAAMGTGLDNYTISYVDGALTVTAASLTVTADNDSKTYGDTQTYVGTEFTTLGLLNTDTVTSVTLASTGDVATATVAGSTYPIVASAAMGTGLDNYTISYVDGALTVNTAALTVTADNATKTYGNTLTFAGTEFTTSGLLNTDTVTSVTLTSAGAVDTAAVAGSPYSIVASAAMGTGLDNYTISYVDGSLTVNMGSTATSTVIDSPTPNSTVGDAVILNATITGFNPTGTVSFYSGATLISTSAAVSNGSGSITHAFTQAGDYSITAEYSGDANNTGSTSASFIIHVVDKDSPDTVTNISSSGSSLVGSSVDFTATVAGAFNPTGTVEFYDGAVLIGTGSLNGSFQATVSHTFVLAGNHDITAHYLGDSNNNPSQAIVTVEIVLTQEVRKDTPTTHTILSVANPSTIGDTVVMTADVTAGYGPTGVVFFKDGGIFIGSGALVGGTATFSTDQLAVGSHNLTAEYQGDVNNNSSTSAVVTVQVVQQMTSVTILGNIPTPVVAPASITFNVTVNGYFPTGSVAIMDGPSFLLNVPLSHGSGSFTYVFTGEQYMHSFVAEYPGDVNNTASVSPVKEAFVAAPSEESNNGEQGAGSNRGSNIGRAESIVKFAANLHLGNLAPGSFGGADAPLAGAEKEYICSIQRSLPRLYTSSYVETLANLVARYIGRDADVIAGWLRDLSTCSDITVSRMGTATVAQVDLKPFYVTSEGIPLSKNATWNKCVTGKFTYQDIQSNPDRDRKGTPKSCAEYHTGSSWYHPDLHLFFDWNLGTKKLTVPAGYVIKKDEAVTIR